MSQLLAVIPNFSSCIQTTIYLVTVPFGGFGQELRALLDEAVDMRQNRLNREEYDETTWSARNFRTFVKQRVSVAVHTAAASEVRDALGLAALDPRGPA